MLSKPLYHDITVIHKENESKIVNDIRSKAKNQYNCWKNCKGKDKFEIQTKLLGLIQQLRIVSNSYFIKHNNIDYNNVFQNSAKINKIINDLDNYVYNDPNKGVVVFSQFTSFLYLLEKVIKEILVGIEVFTFTGNLNTNNREKIIKEFNENINPRIILVSLMTGGCGISLHKGSSTVVLCEPYYNPFVEQQAEERVHRIGQLHQVNIYRYTVNNSVETWIQGIKQKKMQMANLLSLSNNFQNNKEFSFNDISELFSDFVSFNNNNKVIDKNKTKNTKKIQKNKIIKVPKINKK